ncbi:hypothetical protein ERJ75_001246100 [Trypanosoma vivax]|nr:hypothetical protein ERJ75_001246100 [Trypanosoma vivax]
MVQKHPEKQLLSGAAKVQDAPDSDGEAEQEEREGICMPAVPSRPPEQGMSHQAQVRTNLYHKLGRLERGGAAGHSGAPHLRQGVPLQMAAAADADEASGPRRVVTSSAAREAQAEDENRGSGTGRGEWATGSGMGRGRGKATEALPSGSPHGR